MDSPITAGRIRQLRVHNRTLCLAADLVTLQGKLASCAPRSSAPRMCRAQIGCAMNVPWCGWGEGWQALQVFDYKAPRANDNGLKIRVSVVRFRPWPPSHRVPRDAAHGQTSGRTCEAPTGGVRRSRTAEGRGRRRGLPTPSTPASRRSATAPERRTSRDARGSVHIATLTMRG